MITHCRDTKFAISSKCFEVFLLMTVLVAVMEKTTTRKGTSRATRFQTMQGDIWLLVAVNTMIPAEKGNEKRARDSSIWRGEWAKV